MGPTQETLTVRDLAALWAVDRKTARRRLFALERKYGGVVFRRSDGGWIYTTLSALRRCAPEFGASGPEKLGRLVEDHEDRIRVLEASTRALWGRMGRSPHPPW